MHSNAETARSNRRPARWVGLFLALPLVGCISNIQPLSVTEFHPIKAAGNFCASEAKGTAIIGGVMDTALPDALAQKNPTLFGTSVTYMLGVTVASQLASNAVQPGVDNLRVNTNTARLDTMTAKYHWTSDTGEPFVAADATFPISATVNPGDAATFPVQLIKYSDGEVLKSLTGSGTLVIEMTFSGTLEDGSSITSTPVNFALDVCHGCLTGELETFCSGGTITPTCGGGVAAQMDGIACSDATN